MLSSLFDQVEAQQYIIEQYRPIEEGWRAQRIRGDRLEKELRELSVSAAPFVQFVQAKYDRLRRNRDKALQRSSEFEQELSHRLDQAMEIQHLKSAVFKATSARQALEEKHRRSLETARQELDVTTSKLDAERQVHAVEVCRLESQAAQCRK